MLSAANQYICNLVRDFIDLEDMICTEMEVIDGFFTGFPRDSYCYGEQKLERVKAYCEACKCSLENTWYYADAYSDLPVLEQVGRPVCITPEPKLEKIARKRGWPVLIPPTPA